MVTDIGETGRHDEVDVFAVHGEGDSEVDGQGSPDKELVDDCPIVSVQAELQETREGGQGHSSSFSSRPLILLVEIIQQLFGCLG